MILSVTYGYSSNRTPYYKDPMAFVLSTGVGCVCRITDPSLLTQVRDPSPPPASYAVFRKYTSLYLAYPDPTTLLIIRFPGCSRYRWVLSVFTTSLIPRRHLEFDTTYTTRRTVFCGYTR